MCYELLGRSRRSDGRGPVHRDARAGVEIHGEPRNSTPHLIHRACRSTLQRRAWRRDAGRDASRAAARRECAVSPCRRCTHINIFFITDHALQHTARRRSTCRTPCDHGTAAGLFLFLLCIVSYRRRRSRPSPRTARGVSRALSAAGRAPAAAASSPAPHRRNRLWKPSCSSV